MTASSRSSFLEIGKMGKLLLLALCLQLCSCYAAATAKLPDKVLIGYQNWAACEMNETVAAARGGVNVIIWFAVNLADGGGSADVVGGPDPQCVADVAAELDRLSLPTVHLISIGGWDAPHPAPGYTGDQLFAAFKLWNNALPRPYDGFDWDLEGNDVVASSNNKFTTETLNQVLDMSAAAKSEGMVVTLVPAQSYFDVSTDKFNTSLLSSYSDYHPSFAYHGTNSYAYLVAASAAGATSSGRRFDFDAVSIQIYESFSRANQALLQPPVQTAPDYLRRLFERYTSTGQEAAWTVDFGSEGEWPGLRLFGRHAVPLSNTQLVIALSRGDAAGKSCFIWPSDCGLAYDATPLSMRPRGFAFWNIDMEGGTVNGTEATLSFAPALNAFLHVWAAAYASIHEESEYS